MNRIILMLCALTALLIAGCAPDQSDPDAPANAIETYLEARISKDQEQFQGTYCADFEAEAITDFDSFGSVEAELVDMTCTVDSVEDDTAQVSCTGTIDVVYDGENTNSIDLARQTYVATQEDGEWVMCGYGD